MDTVSAKVLGTGAIVLGLVFVVTSVVRFWRPDVDVLLVVLNAALGVLLLVVGVWLWRRALRGRQRRDDR
ncbi:MULTISPECIES: hypothetical protein [unclassified Curtobacterium]|uniref:hypothetical protein n=1 Tax=unclassified Curtobacterium TaxID=257496 RepID=UPI0008DD895F|nr:MULTISPECIES: hypothetical protein [unclassified Curtobacterium]OIH99579.1 hypothetical protein BIU92_01430 [Curtobacterium sp. MCBA15_003]OII30586.1 hypothetical protein BIU94_07465 [Curtobacterium sp. MMLR14_006]